jgi:hypothetical protein
MKSVILIMAAFVLTSCSTPSNKQVKHRETGIDSYAYTTLDVFHDLPSALAGKTFEVVPGETNLDYDLEFDAYADKLRTGLISHGLQRGVATNVDYILFLRYKQLTTQPFNYQNMPTHYLKRYSVRIDMDFARLQPNFVPVCKATITADSYGSFNQSTAIPLALSKFVIGFPFTGENPYHRETKEPINP